MRIEDLSVGMGMRRPLILFSVLACLLLSGCVDIHLVSWFDADSKGRLAYVASNHVANEEIHQIIVSNKDGSESKLVTTSSDLITYVRWSPDDRRLVYATQSPEVRYSELFVIDSSGENKMSLARYDADGEEKKYIWAPEWSPDGKWVLYQLVSNEVGELYVVNVASKSGRKVAGNTGLFATHWCPDGRQIIVGTTSGGGAGDISLGEISTVDVDTGEMHGVAGMLFVPFMTLEWLGNAKVIFTSPSIDMPTTDKKLREAQMGLYHFDLTSQRFSRVQAEKGLVYFVLSPDRKKILQLLEVRDQKADSQDMFDMVVSDVRGREVKPIGQCDFLVMPIWVGNDRIAFVRAEDEARFVVLSLGDGKEKTISLSSILPLPEKEHDAP